MRIGIYSGTFDPIHEGHFLFMQVSAEQFGLDTVLLLPEPKPRYKEDVTDIEHRQRMCELAALQADVDVQVAVFEGEPSHTINGILRRVHEMYPEDEYFIMMGEDVFEHIGSWGSRDDEDGSVADISGNVGFIVALDGMGKHADLQKTAKELDLNVRYVEPPLIKLASRRIRERVAAGETKDVHGLNDDVLKYIKLEGLYGAKQS